MTGSLQSLRERLAGVPTNRRGYRLYDDGLRRDIEKYAVGRVSAGASYKEVAGELGMAPATLLNWFKRAPSKRVERGQLIGFRPVEVQDGSGEESGSTTAASCGGNAVSQPVVVLPSGIRVEGISLAELPEFIARLECR